MSIIIGHRRLGWLDNDDVRETVRVRATSEKDGAIDDALDGGRSHHVGILGCGDGPDKHRGRVVGGILENTLRKGVDAFLQVGGVSRIWSAMDTQQERHKHNQLHHLYDTGEK